MTIDLKCVFTKRPPLPIHNRIKLLFLLSRHVIKRYSWIEPTFKRARVEGSSIAIFSQLKRIVSVRSHSTYVDLKAPRFFSTAISNFIGRAIYHRMESRRRKKKKNTPLAICRCGDFYLWTCSQISRFPNKRNAIKVRTKGAARRKGRLICDIFYVRGLSDPLRVYKTVLTLIDRLLIMDEPFKLTQWKKNYTTS